MIGGSIAAQNVGDLFQVAVEFRQCNAADGAGADGQRNWHGGDGHGPQMGDEC